MRALPAVLSALMILATLAPSTAQPHYVVEGLRQAAAARYQVGGEWVDGRAYVNRYTIVPYKDLFFATTSGSDKHGMDSYAVWEYVDGRWLYIFEHTHTNAGPEAERRLDQLYAKHRFSPAMRKKLMGASQRF